MHRHSPKWFWLTFLSAATGIAACSSDNPITPSGEAGAEQEGGTDGAVTDGTADSSSESSTEGGGTAVDADANTALTDPQIVTIVHVANQAEIQEAQLALMRAVNTQVRDFATMMIADHTAADAALATLFLAADAGPEASAALDAALSADGGLPIVESPISQNLQQEASLELQSLQLKTAAPFDLAYMSGQVATHSEVLQLLDTVLIPAAQNPTLKAGLMQVRSTVATHLMHAIAILNSLASAGIPD